MKSLRVLSTLAFIVSTLACSFSPKIPSLPIGETETPSVTPTFTPSPIPPPTPTALPIMRIENGDAALFNGDYESALTLYRSAYQDSSDANIRAAALWGQARVQYEERRYQESLNMTQQLIAEYPSTAYLAHAYFLQGQAYFELKKYTEAADEWQAYLVLRPGMLDAYVQELRGDALFDAGNFTDALAAYNASIRAPRLDDGILVDMKVAQTRAELGDYEQAQALYDGIAERTGNAMIKAEASYFSALAYQAQGRMDDAYGKFQYTLENYPASYYSYLSLVELLNGGAEVNDLYRGLADYFAGQYDIALERLDAYLAANPVNDGTAHYYRARALSALGNYEAAVQEYMVFINGYSAHEKWFDAWGERAYLQWAQLGNYTDATTTLLNFASAAPTSTRAPEYLMSAARISERADKLDEAAQIWERVASDYPSSAEAVNAIFLAGITRYRQGNYAAALDSFQRNLMTSTDPAYQARAYLWIGKCKQKLGDAAATQEAWQRAQNSDPGGYYSERARDLILGNPPFSPPPIYRFNIDLATERADADAWVRITFKLPDNADLNGLGSLAQDERVIRGSEFWRFGLYEEARIEFENLREELSSDAVNSYRLANYLLDLGLYRCAIFSARQTLSLAGLNDHAESMMAPPYFSHIRYGLYYSDLILPASKDERLDPLFLFSVMRQESFFEGFVHSSAGARGLMQIMPSTGASIASNYGWPLEFDPDDLYRPVVSVKLGTHYLATNQSLLNGSMYGALAAYNSGPGNALVWGQLAGDDPDVFLEVVRFEETRQYIRNIYEIYAIYKRLYSPIQ